MLINKDTGEKSARIFESDKPNNQPTAISTSSILLVPYDPHHVPTYHEWMQDPELQALTASEPLSLDEEYSMQESWRQDGDKLTFIACIPLFNVTQPDHQPQSVKATEADCSNRMLGDINLFLTVADEDPEGCIGEMELMIARSDERRRGYGRAAVLVFLRYLQDHLHEVMDEYDAFLTKQAGDVDASNREGKATKMRLLQLRVKIGSGNVSSINLFESIGFIRVDEGENYFGEVELVFEGFWGEGRTAEMLRTWGIERYQEMDYCR